jgi:hypothetical protein
MALFSSSADGTLFQQGIESSYTCQLFLQTLGMHQGKQDGQKEKVFHGQKFFPIQFMRHDPYD